MKTLTQMRMSQQPPPCHHFDVDNDLSTFGGGTNRKKSKILRKPLPGPVAFMSTEEEEVSVCVVRGSRVTPPFVIRRVGRVLLTLTDPNATLLNP